jgi:hypothetical protein
VGQSWALEKSDSKRFERSAQVMQFESCQEVGFRPHQSFRDRFESGAVYLEGSQIGKHKRGHIEGRVCIEAEDQRMNKWRRREDFRRYIKYLIDVKSDSQRTGSLVSQSRKFKSEVEMNIKVLEIRFRQN